MKKQKLLSITILCLITSFSYAQQKVYKCNVNGETVYSNDEKDKKCKQVEMMGLNEFNPTQKNQVIKDNNTFVTTKAQELYPAPIPLDYVPEKPAPIDEEAEKQKAYKEKVKQIEQGYLNIVGKVLKSTGVIK